ncbi:MAG: glycoside hydrolase family 97 protein [Bacteroidales bacterium]|nr:glycoside hydrolase family 97 protein [Bacteroidales bacterium]
MKKLLSLAFIIGYIAACFRLNAQEYIVSSPDNRLNVNVIFGEKILWTAIYKEQVIFENCPISMTINNDKHFGSNPKAVRKNTRHISREIQPVIATKRAIITDNFTELNIACKGGYSITFRVYNQGVAYRFETSIEGDIVVNAEEMRIHFSDDVISYFPEEESYISHNERLYKIMNIKEISSGQFCSLPVYFRSPDNVNILFTEADLYDYPGMFLYGCNMNALKAGFPKVVLETAEPEQGKDRNEIITSEADYIAHIKGPRSFPWRVFYITDRLAEIVENDLVYQLSTPLKIEETEWIKPGKVAWDWWNANNIYGVDFESGLNTQTYKYYIDFASAYGLEYIILDEGWTKTSTHVTECNPDLDVHELIRYGKEKNVGIILWLLWKPLDMNMEQILDTYAQWGAKGIKVDFMQRNDQYMVKFYERVAIEAAKRKLLVDFHGAFKPAGLNRAYPNVLSHEGVKGLENSKWSKDITPEHDVTLPFIRMAAGPMDFTPGAMDNAQENDFFPRFMVPMSQGTRCHQVAMYVVYESPLQMLCDNPSNYYREKECTEFISQIPTVWDTTVVLAAEIADYIIIARRKDDKWYVGAMTDWTSREFEIDFGFLLPGSYPIEIMQDGINANRNAVDYKKTTSSVTHNTRMKINLAKGGGWAAIITKP